MTYHEVGFRALYKKFAVLLYNDVLKRSVIDFFPDADKANCVLTYGYIDHEAGFTLEILACGELIENHVSFFEGNASIKSIVRIESVLDEEFYVIDDQDGDIQKRFADKLGYLTAYEVSREVEISRGMTILDRARDLCYPDDVLVYLRRNGFQTEGCWVRITSLGKNHVGDVSADMDCEFDRSKSETYLVGTLLNEPSQNFGCHMGEIIEFFAQRTKDNQIVCVADGHV